MIIFKEKGKRNNLSLHSAFNNLVPSCTDFSIGKKKEKKMAASKTLFRAGASLVTRFTNKNPSISHRIITGIPEVAHTPKFLPSFFIPQPHSTTLLHFQLNQNDAESLTNLSSEGFLHPSGLPYLPFFLPNGTLRFCRFFFLFMYFVSGNSNFS